MLILRTRKIPLEDIQWKWGFAEYSVEARRLPHQITKACHQIRDETLDLFHASTTLLWRMTRSDGIIPAPLPLPVLRQIRELRLSVRVLGWIFPDALMPALQVLHLNFTATQYFREMAFGVEECRALLKQTHLQLLATRVIKAWKPRMKESRSTDPHLHRGILAALYDPRRRFKVLFTSLEPLFLEGLMSRCERVVDINLSP